MRHTLTLIMVVLLSSGIATAIPQPQGAAELAARMSGRWLRWPSPSAPAGATIKVKSRWDRSRLRQEFSSAMRTLKRSWTIDGNGRLVMTQHHESIRGSTKPVDAVFDRQ